MRYLLFTILLLSSSLANSSETICPPLEPLPGGADDYRMTENDFSFKDSQWAIKWLEDDIWKVIKSKGSDKALKLLHSSEQFSIPLSSSVSTIKGLIYKLNAQILKKNLELVKLKSLSGSSTKKEVEIATLQYKKARNLFCTFLSSEDYAD